MHRRLLLSTITGVLALLSLAAPAAFSATTIGTIGNGPAGGITPGCAVANNDVPVTCTLIMHAAAAADRAPGGLFTLSAGVITKWHLSIGYIPGPTVSVAPQVFSFAGFPALRYTAVHTGIDRPIPDGGGDLTFDDRMPIGVAQFFGIRVTINGLAGSSPYLIAPTTAAGNTAYHVVESPALADGGAASGQVGPLLTYDSQKFIASADIEPDADGDGYGDETQDGCAIDPSVSGACPVFTAPTIGNFKNTKASAFTFSSSDAGSLTITIERVTSGRKQRGKCKRAAKKGKRCNIYKKVAEFDSPLVAGPNTIPYKLKVGGRSLSAGKYRVTFVATSAKNLATTSQYTFKVKKPKKRIKQ
jgi:hypothetical protein